MAKNKSFLTNRQLLIASMILKKEKGFSFEELAKEIGMLKSVIYYEIPIIKEIFEQYNIEIVKLEKNKYIVTGDEEQKKNLIRTLEKKEDLILVSDSKERNNYIILLLLCLSEPVMLKDIETRFKISKPTAMKSFQSAKNFLEKEHLMVYSRPNYGSYVSGSEVFIRSAFADVLVENYLNESLNTLKQIKSNEINDRRKKKSSIDSLVYDFLTINLIKDCSDVIESYEKKANVKFGDVARLTTILLFAFTAKRIHMSKTIEIQSETIENLKSSNSYTYMIDAIDDFERRIEVKIPENERAYLMVILMNGKSMRDEDVFEHKPSHFEFCEKVTNAIIREAAVYLGPKLIRDESLYKNLFHHMMAVIYRCKNNIPIKNQLLETIKENYPYTYFVADRCRKIAEDMIGDPVSKDEAGFLALYLEISKKQDNKKSKEIKAVVVCVEGLVTAWLMAASVSKYFPEINIVKVLSLYEYKKNDELDGIDLVISTSRDIDKPSIPMIIVNPILNEEDMTELSNYVSKRVYLNDFISARSSGQGILAFLDNDLIQVNLVASDWKDAVDKASYPLLKKGIITKEYIQSIKYNIIKYGPYMISLPGVAILHASPEIKGTKLGVSLSTFSVPVNFGKEENDAVSIIFTLSSPDDQSHMQILEDLFELYQDKTFFSKIIQSKDAGEIRNAILEILSSVEK